MPPVRTAPLARTLVLSALIGCGGDPAPAERQPCGGDLLGGWTFTSATLEPPGDGCGADGAGALTGFIVFNADQRYSLQASVAAWKRTAADPCGFNTADGGFYRTTGVNVCVAGTRDQVDAATCDGAALILDPTTRGAAEYCVDGQTLWLRTATMLNLRSPAEIELTRM